MSDNRTDLPSPSAPNFNQRLRETIQIYLGRQGNPLDRGLTLRDLIDAGVLKVKSGFTLKPGSVSGSIPVEPGPGVVDVYEPDLTPPPTPTGFAVTAAISNLIIEHDAPLYTQGHGHLRTRLYGKIVNAGDPLPTFADASEIAQFSGAVYAHPSNPATTWRLWIKWVTADGVQSADPAGGINGIAATTGQDVSRLVQAMTGPGNPFKVVAEQITLPDGTVVPAGTYTADAFIHNGQITNAKIGNAAIDDAKIANLSASKITAGSIGVGDYIQSTGYAAGSSGWRINGDGNAEFSNATVRGTVYATDGQFKGTVYATDGQFKGTILGGSASSQNSGTGFHSGVDGGVYKWRVGNPSGARIQWSGSAVEVYDSGNTLTLSSGGVDSSSLKAGIGQNLVLNGSYVDGLAGTVAGWRSGGNQHSIGWNLSEAYTVRGEGTAYIAQAGISAVGTVFDANVYGGANGQMIACTPGKRYEVSAYLNTHRCKGYVLTVWYDSAGKQIYHGASNTLQAPQSEVRSLADMTRVHGFVTAPVGATQLYLVVRAETLGQQDPYLFFSRVYFGEAGAAQTEPSPWSPGRGISQITPANATTYIADASIRSAHITDAAITNAKIGYAEITTAKIGANQVTFPQSAYSGWLVSNNQGFAIQDLWANSSGAPAILIFSSHVFCATHEVLEFCLYRDGNLIYKVGGGGAETQLGGKQIACGTIIDYPGEGWHHYELYLANQGSGAGMWASGRGITYLEAKR